MNDVKKHLDHPSHNRFRAGVDDLSRVGSRAGKSGTYTSIQPARWTTSSAARVAATIVELKKLQNEYEEGNANARLMLEGHGLASAELRTADRAVTLLISSSMSSAATPARVAEGNAKPAHNRGDGSPPCAAEIADDR